MNPDASQVSNSSYVPEVFRIPDIPRLARITHRTRPPSARRNVLAAFANGRVRSTWQSLTTSNRHRFRGALFGMPTRRAAQDSRPRPAPKEKSVEPLAGTAETGFDLSRYRIQHHHPRTLHSFRGIHTRHPVCIQPFCTCAISPDRPSRPRAMFAGIRGTSMPESDDDFKIVDQYDSIEDPWLRSEFLDAIGRTRPCIDALRRRRDAAREAARAAPARDEPATSAHGGESRRRAPRSRRRTRVVVTRPPNRGRVRRRYPRPRPRLIVVVIVELG